MNSGPTTEPPVRLNFPATGTSKVSGKPETTKTSNGKPTISAIDVHTVWNGWPVAAWRLWAQRAMMMVATIAITRAMPTAIIPVSKIGFGKASPLLLRNILNGRPTDSRGCGKTERTPRYQKKMTSSGGMLRKTST
ncbi:hypothetical protein ACVMIX_002258 [Rhizobium leguminosarum]